jgi:hypothetical protein
VKNPEWILDSHAFWQKQIEFETKVNSQFCYNPEKNEVANQLIYTASASNNLIYNPFTKEYNCYLLNLLTGVDVLVYDTLAGNWNKGNESNVPPDYWHHNRFFSPLDSNLYLMNGYGHHKYKNTVNRYNYHTKSWESFSLKGDRIHPRYLSGQGKKDEQHLILFGGYGSETGNQEMRPQSYYDLHEIDIQTMESKKIWEMESPILDFAVGNSLIPSADRRTFYALAFPSQQFYSKIVLLEVSMNRPEYSIVGDSIPFDFEDTRSNADLYINPSSSLLIAVVVTPQTTALSQVAVYTLSNPPLALGELYQNGRKGGIRLILLYSFLSLVCAGLLVFAVSLLLRKQKIKRIVSRELQKAQTLPDEDDADAEQKQAIYLPDSFRVFDKNGINVTKEFSPMLRQLFTLLLLYTAKNGIGISSSKLKDALWFDKSEKNAKNNRGVFINKLRQLFEQIGTIKTTIYTGAWKQTTASIAITSK